LHDPLSALKVGGDSKKKTTNSSSSRSL